MIIGKRNKLVTNFFFLGIVQAINSLLQLLVIPYVITVIGMDGFGVVSVAQVVMFYLSVFTDYGFHQTATRDVSVYRSDRSAISRIFFRVLFSRIILCFIGLIILLILLLLVPVFRSHLWVYLMGFVFVVGQAALVNWFFQGLEKMQFIAFATLASRLLFVLLVFLYMQKKEDDFLFLFFLGIGNLVAGSASIFAAIRIFRLEFFKPSVMQIKQELKEGWHIAVSNLSSNTCQYANVFILRFFTNDLMVGYYSIAERLFFAIRQMLAVFSQSIYPQVCQLVQGNKEKVISFFRRIYVPFFFLVMAGSAVLFIFSPLVLSFFIHKDYGHSVPLLRILAIVSVVACLNIPPTLILLAINRTRSYFRIYTLATIANIISNLILVHFFDAKGTVIAILITECFIMAGLMYEVRHHYIVNKKFIPDSKMS
jgi:polysaccharide transporter, PST family